MFMAILCKSCFCIQLCSSWCLDQVANAVIMHQKNHRVVQQNDIPCLISENPKAKMGISSPTVLSISSMTSQNHPPFAQHAVSFSWKFCPNSTSHMSNNKNVFVSHLGDKPALSMSLFSHCQEQLPLDQCMQVLTISSCQLTPIIINGDQLSQQHQAEHVACSRKSETRSKFRVRALSNLVAIQRPHLCLATDRQEEQRWPNLHPRRNEHRQES